MLYFCKKCQTVVLEDNIEIKQNEGLDDNQNGVKIERQSIHKGCSGDVDIVCECYGIIPQDYTREKNKSNITIITQNKRCSQCGGLNFGMKEQLDIP